jgi:hypothetical protein
LLNFEQRVCHAYLISIVQSSLRPRS